MNVITFLNIYFNYNIGIHYHIKYFLFCTLIEIQIQDMKQVCHAHKAHFI